MTNPGSELLTDPAARRTRELLAAVGPAAVFAVAWAMANIVHLLLQTRGDMAVVSWINFAVALWVLGRPTSAHRLAALSAAQVLDTVWLLPFTPDHQILAAFVNLAILYGYLSVGRPDHGSELLEKFAPGARILLLIAYVGAATAKYNEDFVEVSSSCAVALANVGTFDIVERSSPGATVIMVGAIASETLIPVMLLLPRTRRWGVVYAAIFHFLLCLSPAVAVTDFTLTLWALYALFLPVADVEELGRRVVDRWRSFPIVSAYDSVPRSILAAVLLLAVAGASLPANGLAVRLVLWIFTTGFGLYVLFTGARVVARGSATPRRFGRPTWPLMGLALAMLIVVTSPYVGFGTSSRFTMFSGLRTEGAGTNHLFLPSVHLIDSQNDALFVVEANGASAKLEAAAEAHAAVARPEIYRILQDDDVGATFETADGATIVVTPGDDSPLRREVSWWEAKTQHYRLIKVAGTTDDDVCLN